MKAVNIGAKRRCMTTNHPPTLGLVLAGGLARRMGGGDKARIEIGGVTILDRVLATLSAHCTGIIINANGDPKRFADTGLTVVSDSVPDFAGPLAGILAGLDWLANQKNGIEWIVSVPGDCPFLPDDLVERLHQARRELGAGVPLACARSGFTAWGVELARKANLTLIGRARGKRFVALAGEDRIVFDQDLDSVEDEGAKHRRKAAVHDD